MSEASIDLPIDSSGSSKDVLRPANTPEVARLQRISHLLGGQDRRELPRESGGKIVIEEGGDRLIVHASLPPTPNYKSYDVRWTLGLSPSVQDRVFIRGTEHNDTDFRHSEPLKNPNDIGALDDVLGIAEQEVARQQRVQEGEHGQA